MLGLKFTAPHSYSTIWPLVTGLPWIASHRWAAHSRGPMARNDGKGAVIAMAKLAYFPSHFGGRFSENAFGPSTKSCDAAMAFTAG